MKVALIQSPLIWENPIANRQHFESQIRNCDSADLIVLPEMFTTGFSMNANNVAEKMDGPTVGWIKEIAAESKAAITGSIIINENGAYFNRLLFALPSGELYQYDKRHLFTLAGEDKVYTSGAAKITVNYLGWKIVPFICYDLRFPVFSRNDNSYDLALYVANWPEPRIHAWDTLLKARAIENIAYVVGVNRIGSDNSKHAYPGHSQVIDPLGNVVVNAESNEGVYLATIDKNELVKHRRNLGFLNDRDEFTVR